MIARIFNTLPTNIQNDVTNTLWEEWSINFKESGILNRHDLCEKLNQSNNMFFVFFGNDCEGFHNFIGTASINYDTPIETFNTNYWINNIFVRKEIRYMRRGSSIMRYVENYLKNKGVNIAHLWCDTDIIPFYSKLDWTFSEFDETNPKREIMFKML